MSVSLTMAPPVAAPVRRPPAIESAVLGTLVFVITEAMFFTALVSAFLVIKAATGNIWVPPENVRLPVATTGLNSLILMMSGFLTWRAGRLFASRATAERAERAFAGAIALASFFVIFQGYEWVKLISVGMTMTSGVFGATFFLLIGSHALHALTAIIAMLVVQRRMVQGKLTQAQFQAMRIFWYFIVAVWPILYGLVYF